MKRKFYISLPFVALTLIALLYACKKSDSMETVYSEDKLASPPLDVINSGPIAEKGWLEFATLQTFQQTMTRLHEQFQDQAGLNKWESAYATGSFVSLRKFYEQIDADTSGKRSSPTVDSLINSNQILDCPDSWFATVLSKDGFIQISDTVYSFKPGNKNGEAYAVPARHADALRRGELPQLLEGSKMHLTSFFTIPVPRWHEVGDTQVGPTKLSICLYPSGIMPNWWGQTGGDIYSGDDGLVFPEHNGRQVKLQYHRWRVGYIFYASTGARVKMLKHTRFAGWQSVTYANEMMMEACCKGKVFIPGFPLIPFSAQTSPAWPNLVRYAENNLEKTLKWTATGLMNDILLDHFNFHFKVNYRDRIVERSIRQ